MTTLISEQVENQQENGSELNMVATVTGFLNQNSKGFSWTSENIKKMKTSKMLLMIQSPLTLETNADLL